MGNDPLEPTIIENNQTEPDFETYRDYIDGEYVKKLTLDENENSLNSVYMKYKPSEDRYNITLNFSNKDQETAILHAASTVTLIKSDDSEEPEAHLSEFNGATDVSFTYKETNPSSILIDLKVNGLLSEDQYKAGMKMAHELNDNRDTNPLLKNEDNILDTSLNNPALQY